MSERALFQIPPEPDEWKQFLFNKVHWKPGESAWAVAKSWHEARGVPSKVADLLGEDVRLVGMRPEYEVKFGRGGGKGGVIRCDVFAHVEIGGRTCALVIEAKVNEDFDEKLCTWRKGKRGNPRSPANRERRLRKICEVLGVKFPPSDNLRFQLFSRAFAAVQMAECLKTDMAATIVQSFSDCDSGHDDFLDFCDLFSIRPSINGISTASVPGGPPLLLGWAKCPLPKR